MDFLDMSIPNVRGFEGNTNVQLYFDATTNEMIITESWASKKAHGKYIKFISENGVMKQLLSYLEKPPTIKYYQPLDV
ncbi:MAG: hypothetical protein HRT53_08240 [Colwellia sp.]|nr:hypothetical protein [Colwellia sp.]